MDPTGVIVGIFRYEGYLYLVRPNKQMSRSYAMKLWQPIGAPRPILEYEKVMYELEEENRVTDFTEEEIELLRALGHCVWCGRALGAGGYKGTGIGPVCAERLSLVHGPLNGTATPFRTRSLSRNVNRRDFREVVRFR